MPIEALPKIGARAWAVLRSKASNAPSTKFNSSLVAAALELGSAESAQANIIRPMRALGILDEEGSLTPVGNKWRNDSTYAEACQEILDKVYPSDLAALTDEHGKPSTSQVKTWLSHNGFGDSNARQMAATYVMIASKEIPQATASTEGRKATPPAKKAAVPAKTAVAPQNRAPSGAEPPKDPAVQQPPPPPGHNPGIHLDIQIHVPSDASPEQIDAIFRSMAKHIYGRETN